MRINEDREKLIEAIGVDATNLLQNLQDEIVALRDYLKIVKVYQTSGWRYVRDVAGYQDEAIPSTKGVT